MKVTTKQLYALASELGLVERGSKEDAFHQIIFRVTKKEHVNELTDIEKSAVLRELQELKSLRNIAAKHRKHKEVPGMITEGQQRMVWRLMYRLAELDPSEKTVCERLIGVIRKELGVTAYPKEPFKWVNFDGGTKLIEQLKRYVRSAEKKGGGG